MVISLSCLFQASVFIDLTRISQVEGLLRQMHEVGYGETCWGGWGFRVFVRCFLLWTISTFQVKKLTHTYRYGGWVYYVYMRNLQQIWKDGLNTERTASPKERNPNLCILWVLIWGCNWCNFHLKKPCGGNSTSHTWKEINHLPTPLIFFCLSMWIFMGCFWYPWVKQIELEAPPSPPRGFKECPIQSLKVWAETNHSGIVRSDSNTSEQWKNPGWLFDRGDYTTQFYGNYNKPLLEVTQTHLESQIKKKHLREADGWYFTKFENIIPGNASSLSGDNPICYPPWN